MTTVAAKGKRAGTPNYKNDLLLNVVEVVLPAGAERWKIVAQRYQQSSGESFLRFYDDLRRHFNDKLCKKNQRKNNKSAPLLHVARAKEIQRKILINEATMNLGEDNENDEDEDDDDDDDEDVNDFEASVAHETPSSVSEIAPVAAVIPDDRPKKRAKFDDRMKTKISKPTQSNPRGGIAGTIAELTSTITSNQQMNLIEMMNKQQQSSDHMMQIVA